MHAVLLAITAGLCWGVGELFTKSVLHTGKVGPITAIAVRSTVALPILWAAYYVYVHRMGKEPARWYADADMGTLLKLALGSGVVAGALAMVAFYGALSVGEVSRVKPIAFSLAPALAVVLAVELAVAAGLIGSGVVLLATK